MYFAECNHFWYIFIFFNGSKNLIFSFRDHLIICKCRRCEDPSELGSYMSALKCPKCDDHEEHDTNRNPFAKELRRANNATTDNHGWILPKSPLDFNSSWTCSIHRSIEVGIRFYIS